MLSKLISIAMLLFSATANATVLLEENFDSVPDWVSAQEESKSCGSGNDAFYFAGTCTTNCPPPLTTTTNWTGAYYASSVYCDDAGNQMYQINSNSPPWRCRKEYGVLGRGLANIGKLDGWKNCPSARYPTDHDIYADVDEILQWVCGLKRHIFRAWVS